MTSPDNDPIARRLRELHQAERLEAMARAPRVPDDHDDEALSLSELQAMDD